MVGSETGQVRASHVEKVAYIVEGGPEDLLAVAEVTASDDRQRHEDRGAIHRRQNLSWVGLGLSLIHI